MAKKKASASAKKDQWKAPVKFGRGSIGINSVSIGVKVERKFCSEAQRDMFVSAVLTCTLSTDPETGEQPVLEGMDEVHSAIRLPAKVTRHGCSESHITFSLSIEKGEMPSSTLYDLSGVKGSLIVHSVSHGEDPDGDE